MQGWGFSVPVIEGHLRLANNKKLIETPQRVTFEEDEAGLHGDMPENFRIGSVHAYHVNRWITEFSYLDAMSYDTPILDQDIGNRIEALVDSYAIQDRYQRAIKFRGYLTRCWHESLLKPTYFDWTRCLPIGNESFDRVKAAIEREIRSGA